MSLITSGLLGYWNSKQGVNGDVWENLASDSALNDATIVGAIATPQGMTFDGVDDLVSIPRFNDLVSSTSFTIEFRTRGLTTPMLGDGNFFVGGGLTLGFNRTSAVARAFSQISFNKVVSMNPTASYTGEVMTSFVWDTSIQRASLYYNGGLLFTTSFSSWTVDEYRVFSNSNMLIGGDSRFKVKGVIDSIRIYNTPLTQEQIRQNYNVGWDIGLGGDESPKIPPTVEIVSVDRIRISGNPPIDKSIIKFKPDIDIVEWRANVLGVSHDTGTIADSGEGIISADEEVEVVVDWTKVQEGINRINIYGKSDSGLWTLYDDS